MKYIQHIQRAIKELHGCDSTHLDSVPVREMFRGQTAWEGVVEVFELAGHPKATKAYAWGYPTEQGEPEIVTVLELAPVDSPEMAVKIAIAAAAKSRRFAR